MFARFFVFLSLFLSLVSSGVHAQTAMGWTVRNISNQTLDFETFSHDRGTWKKQQIFPNQSVKYSMTSPTGKFRITTENRGFVEYQVKDGGSYSLGWDKAKGVWDMKTVAGATGNSAPVNKAANLAALSAFEVHNKSNNLISFETLDPTRNTWVKQTINANEKKSLTLSPGVAMGKIRVSTENRGFVQYDVRPSWKYSLVWDAAKGVWDFRTVQKAS
ncbi:MAG: hypothetical protein V4772_28570 [Pseudomonadota bacterium]